MKNRKLIKSVFNTVVCTSMAFTMFALTACNVTPEDPGDNGGDNPPAVQPVELTAPTVTLTDNIISWNNVNYADGYEIFEGETSVSTQTATYYSINKLEGGTYIYTVKATSSDSKYTASAASNSVSYSCVSTYTVEFIMDEDTKVYDKQYVKEGEKAKEIAKDPAKPGYEFDKWVTEKNGTEAYNFDTAITKNTKIYSSWMAKSYESFTVVFNSNGGSAVPEQTINVGAKAEEPSAPTKENFNFGGWYADEALTEAFDFNTPIEKATTLYAKWTLQTGVEAVTEASTFYFGENATADTANNIFALPQGTELEKKSEEAAEETYKSKLGALTLDATVGKLSNNGRGDQYCQFNKDTSVSFYVDKACNVKVSMFDTNYTVNGIAATSKEQTFEITQPDFVNIVATGNSYIVSIEVTYPEPAVPVTADTKWIFGANGTADIENHVYVWGTEKQLQGGTEVFEGLTIDATASGAKISNQGRTDQYAQFNNGVTLSFTTTSACTVKVNAYSDEYEVNNVAATAKEQSFDISKAGEIVIKATGSNTYILDVQVTLKTDGGDNTGIPAGYENVTTSVDMQAAANEIYGSTATANVNVPTGGYTHKGKFFFEKGRFEPSNKYMNTQGGYTTITVTGLKNTIKIEAMGASSGGANLTFYDKDGTTVIDSVSNVADKSTFSFSAVDVPAGTYRLAGSGSIRYSKIEVTELLESGIPASMDVKSSSVNYLVGRDFVANGVTGTVKYTNNAEQVKSDLVIDSSSVDTTKPGEYIVRAFYTENDETVTGMYSVYVYEVSDLHVYTYRTNGNKQTTFKNVYTTDATDLSLDGLTVSADAKCGTRKYNFNLLTTEYTVDKSAVNFGQAGTYGVKIQLKDKAYANVSLNISIVGKAAVENNTVTVSVDPSKAVSGTNFHTVTDAIVYLGNFDAGVKKVINIADGEYYEKVSIGIPNVRLVGSATKTPDATTDNGVVIWFDAISGDNDPAGSAYGTNGSATVTVTDGATGFVAENITFKNKYNTYELYRESLTISSNSQAVALLVESNSAAFYNCKMTSYHDTLYSNKGNHYYKNCWVEGHTDFIFGQNAISYFDNCTIFSIGSGENNGGYIAAYQNQTNAYGPIFNGCTFTSDDNVKTGSIALGRAWGKEFKMVVINSSITDAYSTAAHTSGTSSAQRYVTMSGNEPKPENMLEYNNTGAGAITESIANTCTYMTETQADAYKLENISAFSFVNAE